MMKTKLTISIFLIFLTSINVNSQSNRHLEDEHFANEIFSFINNLNNDIDTFFVKEQAGNVCRNLNYFKSDFEKYLSMRKSLMDNLSNSNYKITNKAQAKKSVKNLILQLDLLLKRLDNLTPFINEKLSSEAKSIIKSIQLGFRSNQTIYLSDLEKLISDESNIDKSKIKAQGENIYKNLKTSFDLLEVVILKLNKKFNIECN